jgi:hypothetical protein
MKGDPVPSQDHIARLCGGAKLDDDRNVTGACFLPRLNEEYLSVNWLEPLHPEDRTVQLTSLRQVLAGKVTLGAKAKLAVLNVGEVRNHVLRESPDRRKLRVLHEPEANDAFHCGIYDIEPDPYLIADLIVEVVREVYPARA